jgi:UDP-N-acetylglucosamine 2-epimerase
MLAGLAEVIARTAPDLVIVRGDTNSTLAGAIAAKQLLLPLAHIEGGMRSYDRTMPEEINRVVADHISDIALVTDEAARERLAREGVRDNVYVCGDVMYDVFLRARDQARDQLGSRLRALCEEPYDLLTLHRAENTDDRERLRTIVAGFANAPRRVIFPVHPRTAARLAEFELTLPAAVCAIEPLGYLDIVALECGARAIFTDSGGVQREAYFAEVPCVTLRDTTEWTNTVDAGWNRLVGANTAAIATALRAEYARPPAHPPLFGEGDAAERIVRALEMPATLALVAEARATRAARGYATSAVERTGTRTTTDASMR